MNTTELTEHLRGATAALEPPPGFAADVLRGGRRRRARRRLTVAASVLAVVAVAGTATVVTLREDAPAPVADARLTAPTTGDLADDQAFLDEAREAWRDGLPYAPEAARGYYDDRRGEPHVYWAGDTPAGHAAIVLQQVYVHPTGEVPENGLRTAEGLVAIDPVDGRLKLVGTRSIGGDEPGRADYYRFGPEDRTLLIVDHGQPVHYSIDTALVEREDGGRGIRYDWERAEPDGDVAIVPIPADRDPRAVVAFQGNDPPEQLPVENVTYDRMSASTYLSLRLTDPAHRMRSSLLRWGDSLWAVGEPLGLQKGVVDVKWGAYRYAPGEPDVAVSAWSIVAGLPDGRVVILKERQRGGAEPRLIARVAPNPTTETMELVDGGTVDSDAVLPIRFHIPDGGGWIVADKGKEIGYRTSPESPWQKAGKNAALLPDNVTEVLVGDLYVRLR